VIIIPIIKLISNFYYYLVRLGKQFPVYVSHKSLSVYDSYEPIFSSSAIVLTPNTYRAKG